MQSLLRKLSLLDWVVALVTLLYGLATQSWLVAALGVFSCAVAWYNPAKRMQRKLLRHSKASRAEAEQQAAAQAALKRAEEEAAYEAGMPPPTAAHTLLRGPVRYAGVVARIHPLNHLTPGSTNLYVAAPRVRRF